MKVIEFYKTRKKSVYSLEVFPPKDNQLIGQIYAAIESLKKFNPAFVNVTCGAFGRPQRETILIAEGIKKNLGLESVVHLTCVGKSAQEIDNQLNEMASKGIENILALRGDAPEGDKVFQPTEGGYRYASELVTHIKHFGQKRGTDFCIGVAGYPEGHPESPNKQKDLEYLKIKVDAGADFIITQMFFDVNYFLRFRDECRKIGIKAPIIPGVMPTEKYSQIERFTSKIKINLPPTFRRKLEEHREDEEYIKKVCIENTLSMCRKLIEEETGGIHFFILNRADQLTRILDNI